MYTKLDEVLQKVKNSRQKFKIAVAAAEDREVLEAIKLAYSEGFVTPLLIGNIEKIKKIAKDIDFLLEDSFLLEADSPIKASKIAVSKVKMGECDVLMKGLVQTADFLRAILDRKNGIKKSRVLSHLALFEIETYHKLIAVSDVALNVYPNIEEKISIIENSSLLMNKLGIKKPKVALLSCVEFISPKIKSSNEAALITSMFDKGQLQGDFIIDGPLALDNAISKEAAIHKNISSEVAGDSDILIVPNIDTGNVLYKSITYLAKGKVASVLMGGSVPIVLTSRSDSSKNKLFSIALASLVI